MTTVSNTSAAQAAAEAARQAAAEAARRAAAEAARRAAAEAAKAATVAASKGAADGFDGTAQTRAVTATALPKVAANAMKPAAAQAAQAGVAQATQAGVALPAAVNAAQGGATQPAAAQDAAAGAAQGFVIRRPQPAPYTSAELAAFKAAGVNPADAALLGIRPQFHEVWGAYVEPLESLMPGPSPFKADADGIIHPDRGYRMQWVESMDGAVQEKQQVVGSKFGLTSDELGRLAALKEIPADLTYEGMLAKYGQEFARDLAPGVLEQVKKNPRLTIAGLKGLTTPGEVRNDEWSVRLKMAGRSGSQPTDLGQGGLEQVRRNSANGSYLSVGCEGGYVGAKEEPHLSYMGWTSSMGLVAPKGAAIAINDDDTTLGLVVGAVVTFATGGAGLSAWAAGAAGGAAQALASGGDPFKGAALGALKGGLTMVTPGLTEGLGGGIVGEVGAHALTGGVWSVANGGSFGRGALTGAVGTLAGQLETSAFNHLSDPALGLSPTLAQLGARALGGALRSAATGGSGWEGALAGGAEALGQRLEGAVQQALGDSLPASAVGRIVRGALVAAAGGSASTPDAVLGALRDSLIRLQNAAPQVQETAQQTLDRLTAIGQDIAGGEPSSALRGLLDGLDASPNNGRTVADAIEGATVTMHNREQSLAPNGLYAGGASMAGTGLSADLGEWVPMQDDNGDILRDLDGNPVLAVDGHGQPVLAPVGELAAHEVELNRPLEVQRLAEVPTETANAYLGVMQQLDGHPLAQQRLQVMLLSDHLGGPLASLNQLATADLQPGVDRSEVLSELVRQIYEPRSIQQLGANTCAAATAQKLLATSDPAEYARIVTALVTTGKVEFANGDTMQLLPESLRRFDYNGQTDQRSLTDRVMQGAIMNYAAQGSGETYSPVTDVRFTSTGERAGEGLDAAQTLRAMSITGANYQAVDTPAATNISPARDTYLSAPYQLQLNQVMARMQDELAAGRPVPASLRWADELAAHPGHEVMVVGLYEDPGDGAMWVDVENPHGELDRIPLEDFRERLKGVQVPVGGRP